MISFHRSKSHDNPNLITCGFDGLIVRRDCDEPRRVFNLFAAHHRAEGGCRFASLVDDSTIVSLGRNGDLVANRSPLNRFQFSFRFILDRSMTTSNDRLSRLGCLHVMRYEVRGRPATRLREKSNGWTRSRIRRQRRGSKRLFADGR